MYMDCTCTSFVSELLWLFNGTVTKHGCSGHPSYIATLFNIFKVDVKLCHKARDTYTTSAQVNNHIIIIIIVQ